MSFSPPRLIASLALLSLFGIGCFRSASPSPSVAPSPSPVVARSACEHPYYPLRTGYAVTFKDSFNSLIDGSPTVDRYTVRATDVGLTNATLDVLFASSGLHSTQDITCDRGALMARAYVDLASSGRAFKVETTAVTGEYLPRDLTVGSSWQQTYTIVMKPTGTARPEDIGTTPDMHGTVTIQHRAVSEERVTVPFGTYTAIMVKSSTQMKLDAIGNGVSAELPGVSIESTEWWARGVGMIKAQTQMGSGFASTAEAETIVIP